MFPGLSLGWMHGGPWAFLTRAAPSFPRGVRVSARGGILRWGPLKLRTIFARLSSQWVVTRTRSWDMGATA